MGTTIRALELTGTIDEYHHLRVDETLPFSGPARVRVIVLYPSFDEDDDAEWLQVAAHNPAFEFLRDPEEDIYSLADGKPFYDEI